MSAETVREGQKPLAVVLTPEEANAIVYTVAFLAVAAAEDLDLMAVSIRPPDLLAISARCARVGRLAAINDQLAWSCQRSGEGQPLVITASDVDLRELAAVLEATADDRRRFPDGALENFAFDRAARAIRETVGVTDTSPRRRNPPDVALAQAAAAAQRPTGRRHG